MVTEDCNIHFKLSAMLFLKVWDKIFHSPTHHQAYFKLKFILISTPDVYSQSQEVLQWDYRQILSSFILYRNMWYYLRKQLSALQPSCSKYCFFLLFSLWLHPDCFITNYWMKRTWQGLSLAHLHVHTHITFFCHSSLANQNWHWFLSIFFVTSQL